MQTNNQRTISPVASDLSSFAASVVRLRQEGLRDPEIARRLGVEKSTLDKRMKDFRRQERRR